MSQPITVDPNIHAGKPCVAGTRIPVADVLELVREDIPFSAIIKDYYPDLDTNDVRACVQYALDTVNLDEIHVASSSP